MHLGVLEETKVYSGCSQRPWRRNWCTHYPKLVCFLTVVGAPGFTEREGNHAG